MTTSEGLQQQIQDTSLKKLHRTLLGGVAIVFTGVSVAVLTPAFTPQEKNPYAQTPEVQAYDWVHKSLMQIREIPYHCSSLLIDPPVPDASLSALVEQHNAQFRAPFDSLQQTATSLNKRLEELATLQPVIDYRLFEAHREKFPIHSTSAGIGIIILGIVYLMTRSLSITTEQYRLQQQARKPST